MLISIVIMSQSHAIPAPSFLLKLRDILSSEVYSNIIRWDKSGEAICVVCIHALEEVVLPQYFRHSRFTSFVRQLNMYGFGKRKAEKSMAATFYNKHFTKANINFSAISKKGKKQIIVQNEKENVDLKQKQNQSNNIQHQFSTQLEQNILKISAYNRQILKKDKEVIQQQRNKPEICQLIQQLNQRAGSLLNDIDWLNCRQLELLLRQPKYQKVGCAVLGIVNLQDISPFTQLKNNSVSWERMEFIL